MKIFFMSFILFTASCVTFAGGFTVRNGGGLAEFNFEFAALQTPALLQKCLSQLVCELTPQERDLATRLLQMKPLKLIFLTEVGLPGVLRWQDETSVVVNQARLYPQDQPFSTAQAAIALITLRAQSLGANASSLPFAQKVVEAANVAAETLSMKSFGYVEKGFSFVRLHSEKLFIFQDDAGTKTLTQSLEKALECPEASAKAQFQSVEHLSWGDLHGIARDRVTIQSRSQVHYRCGMGSVQKNYVADLETTLELKLTAGTATDFENGAPQVRFEMNTVGFELSLISAE
jgi:hypothetical protein